MSFAGSIQMIFFSMLTCTLGSQGRPNNMAAANFLWLHFLNNRSSIQPSLFGDQRNWVHWKGDQRGKWKIDPKKREQKQKEIMQRKRPKTLLNIKDYPPWITANTFPPEHFLNARVISGQNGK